MVDQNVSDLAFLATLRADIRKMEQRVEKKVCHWWSLNNSLVSQSCFQRVAGLPVIPSLVRQWCQWPQPFVKRFPLKQAFTSQTVMFKTEKVKVKVRITAGVDPISYPDEGVLTSQFTKWDRPTVHWVVKAIKWKVSWNSFRYYQNCLSIYLICLLSKYDCQQVRLLYY